MLVRLRGRWKKKALPRVTMFKPFVMESLGGDVVMVPEMYSVDQGQVTMTAVDFATYMSNNSIGKPALAHKLTGDDL